VATRTKARCEVGYVKYSGGAVEGGVIDAGSAGSALLGLDEALRFFNARQSPEFANLQYDIPVKTRDGSWEAVVLGGMVAVGGAFSLGYAKRAGEKLAENDFKDIGITDILKKSVAAMKKLAEVIKHTRRARGWESARLSANQSGAEVAVLNDRGNELLVPVEFFMWYQQVPAGLLVRLTSVVREDRVLSIGMAGDSPEEAVRITEQDKPLFDGAPGEELEEDILFPELMHGNAAVLDGRLIRGSEASNSIGLEYQGHIINCVPLKGNVRQYKSALFLRCRVSGRITRLTKSRFMADRRPTLIIEKVVPLESDVQSSLFEA
jgi:hypothetical protein